MYVEDLYKLMIMAWSILVMHEHSILNIIRIIMINNSMSACMIMHKIMMITSSHIILRVKFLCTNSIIIVKLYNIIITIPGMCLISSRKGVVNTSDLSGL